MFKNELTTIITRHDVVLTTTVFQEITIFINTNGWDDEITIFTLLCWIFSSQVMSTHDVISHSSMSMNYRVNTNSDDVPTLLMFLLKTFTRCILIQSSTYPTKISTYLSLSSSYPYLSTRLNQWLWSRNTFSNHVNDEIVSVSSITDWFLSTKMCDPMIQRPIVITKISISKN